MADVRRIIITVEGSQKFVVRPTSYKTYQVVTSFDNKRVYESSGRAAANTVAAFLNSQLGLALVEKE